MLRTPRQKNSKIWKWLQHLKNSGSLVDPVRAVQSTPPPIPRSVGIMATLPTWIVFISRQWLPECLHSKGSVFSLPTAPLVVRTMTLCLCNLARGPSKPPRVPGVPLGHMPPYACSMPTCKPRGSPAVTQPSTCNLQKVRTRTCPEPAWHPWRKSTPCLPHTLLPPPQVLGRIQSRLCSARRARDQNFFSPGEFIPAPAFHYSPLPSTVS